MKRRDKGPVGKQNDCMQCVERERSELGKGARQEIEGEHEKQPNFRVGRKKDGRQRRQNIT